MFKNASPLVHTVVLGSLIAGGLALTPLAGYSDTQAANSAAHQAFGADSASSLECPRNQRGETP
jgi:hypothetical protein